LEATCKGGGKGERGGMVRMKQGMMKTKSVKPTRRTKEDIEAALDEELPE